MFKLFNYIIGIVIGSYLVYIIGMAILNDICGCALDVYKWLFV
jgi:hypothetical protein